MKKRQELLKILLLIFTFYSFNFSLLGQEKSSKIITDSTSIAINNQRSNNALNQNSTYPENRGANFSSYSKDSLLQIISTNKDKIILRKAAKILGDKYISNKSVFQDADKAIVNEFTEKYMALITSENSNEREEAKQQIERLWQPAAPTLLKYLDNEDPAKSELAAKSLILMRDESIIKQIIEQANKTNDKKKRRRYVFILSKMQEQRSSLVPNRNCLSPDESNKLYNSLVLPAIEALKK